MKEESRGRIKIFSIINCVLIISLLLTTPLVFSGPPAPSPIGEFGTIINLDEARKMVVNLKIKLPDPLTLPKGYELQAVLVEPRGGPIRETYSDRIFQPETLHLYYSNASINGSMYSNEHPEWVVITESYALGSNSTRPYGTDNPETGYKVGWFYGYPGYLKDSLMLVYQFEEEMAYRIYAPLLSQEQVIEISEPLLLEHKITMNALPNSQNLAPKSSTSFFVNIRSIEEFEGIFKLDVDTPIGVSANFQPETVEIKPFKESSSILTLKAENNTSPINSTLSIIATELLNSNKWKAQDVTLNLLDPEVSLELP